MVRLLLNELQFEILDVLAREGGMTFAAVFDRVHARTGADARDVLKAAQDLYDLSFADVRRVGAGALPKAEESARALGSFVDDLDPAELRGTYRQLDALNVGSYLADTRGVSDPFHFSASSLGLAEHLKPGYAERAAMRSIQRSAEKTGSEGELPPPESLPTLPLD